MADEKKEPLKPAEGAGTPERGEPSGTPPKAEEAAAPKAPASAAEATGEPAKPPAAVPAKPAAAAPTSGESKPEGTASPKAPEGPGAGSAGPAKPPAAAPTKPAAEAPPKAAGAAPPKAPAGAPAKPAAAAPPKPAAPKAPVKPDPWTSPLVDELQKRFPGAVTEPVIFRNQPSMNVARQHLLEVCNFLKSADGGAYNMLTDETAADYPKREQRFDVVYHLYSFQGNNRLRLRVQVAGDEPVPSVVGVWPTANWLEREIFDMFGIVFEGHPDLKRLLLPDEWVGHPLRKDYDILRQDQDWVKANLGIDSGQ